MSKQHTPWEIVEHSWSDSSVYDSEGKCLLTVSIYNDATEENQEQLEDEMSERLKTITLAVNNHDRLVEALEHCIEIMEDSDVPDHLVETYGNAIMNYSNLLTELKS